MRLTHLRFANLNSLAGEWSIDLTHPDYLTHGLFAITGPTGSGKTTLLDAICLALYGSTPRLGRISRSANDIMARQTGECFAQAIFETETGRYLAHWSQHRARRKPDGELQTPKHELANADDGKIIDSSLRGVAEHIERLTGMDFERFTRSALLAQGAFAAFLQASPDERAPILEQITGTDLYSDISVRVHLLRNQERAAQQAIESELATVQLLSPDELNALTQRQAELNQTGIELHSHQAKLTQARDWLAAVQGLQSELEALENKGQILNQEISAFEPQRERLQKALRALELAGKHTALGALREQLRNATNELGQLQQTRTALGNEIENSGQALARAEKQLAHAQQQRHEYRPLLRQVRELDHTLIGLKAPLDAAERAIQALNTQHQKLQAQRASESQELHELVQNAERLDALQRHHTADASLALHLRALQQRHDELMQQRQNVEHTEQSLEQSTQALDLAKQHVMQRQADTQALRQKLEALTTQTTELRASQARLLDGADPTDLRRQEATMLADQADLAQISLVVDQLASNTEARQVLERQTKETTHTLTHLQQQLTQQEQQKSSLERELDLLQTQHQLQQRIASLEKLRHELHNGEPCPLCGALNHPYAKGHPPAGSDTLEHLEATRHALRQATQNTQKLSLHRATLERDLEHQAQRSAILQSQRSELHSQLNDMTSELDLKSPLDALRIQLKDKQSALAGKLMLHEQRRVALDRLQAQIATLTQDEQNQSTGMITVLNQERDAQERLAVCQRENEHALVQRQRALEHVQKVGDTLIAELANYGALASPSTPLELLLQELQKRSEQWSHREQALTALNQQIPTRQANVRHFESLINDTEKRLTDQHAALEALKTDYRQGREQRLALFGDRDPDQEEHALDANLQRTQTELESARVRHAALAAQSTDLAAREEQLTSRLQSAQIEHENAAERFKQDLAAHGFSDENEFQVACMAPEQRQHLSSQLQRLQEGRAALKSEQERTRARLSQEQARNLWQDSADKLEQQWQSINEQREQTAREQGALAQQLLNHENQRRQLHDKQRALEEQRERCRHWDRLHELIGSADGKKYRNFAQGLTFDVMISHANQQLIKMSDRYLLVRDSNEPLSLNVIDNHQAGEVRSTRNLSGGESFLVSLALALGLANMSSRNVRVDSLFLDEGFGTLDEQALDTALETLASLHHEGKLIGVISHVPALKERISVQIQVIPSNGGRSRLSGPGCSGEASRP